MQLRHPGGGAGGLSAEALRESAAFAELRAAAARLGRDPMQIQGPGGNVSLKADGVMLVKASGTWLADAETEDVFTAVDAASMTAAVAAGAPASDLPEEFQVGDGLKPSIETGFHAILDAPVVLHTHCVATLARSTAPLSAAELEPLGLVRVDYAKPGAALAKSILEAWRPGARGVVLANHGIIATGATVAEAEAVLAEAAAAFGTGPAPHRAPDPTLDADLADSGWRPLSPGATTALAFDPTRLDLALGPALFPDQVIFLGPAPFAGDLPLRAPEGPARPLALLPNRGAAIPVDASPALEALAEMMGDVVFRLPDTPSRLNEGEIAELLGWDAEKYRQALEKARADRLRDSAS